jgi:hypothetical protein
MASLKEISYVKLIDSKEKKWYYTWVKKHDSGYTVHSNYASYKFITPVDNAPFYEMDYGMWNSDPFNSFDGAVNAMKEKVRAKVKKGYEIAEEITL